MTTPFHEAFRVLSRIDAPIVTAAHGSVAGGGTWLRVRRRHRAGGRRHQVRHGLRRHRTLRRRRGDVASAAADRTGSRCAGLSREPSDHRRPGTGLGHDQRNRSRGGTSGPSRSSGPIVGPWPHSRIRPDAGTAARHLGQRPIPAAVGGDRGHQGHRRHRRRRQRHRQLRREATAPISKEGRRMPGLVEDSAEHKAIRESVSGIVGATAPRTSWNGAATARASKSCGRTSVRRVCSECTCPRSMAAAGAAWPKPSSSSKSWRPTGCPC